MIATISEGCHVVYVQHRSWRSDDEQWRLSFSFSDVCLLFWQYSNVERMLKQLELHNPHLATSTFSIDQFLVILTTCKFPNSLRSRNCVKAAWQCVYRRTDPAIVADALWMKPLRITEKLVEDLTENMCFRKYDIILQLANTLEFYSFANSLLSNSGQHSLLLSCFVHL